MLPPWLQMMGVVRPNLEQWAARAEMPTGDQHNHHSMGDSLPDSLGDAWRSGFGKRTNVSSMSQAKSLYGVDGDPAIQSGLSPSAKRSMAHAAPSRQRRAMTSATALTSAERCQRPLPARPSHHRGSLPLSRGHTSSRRMPSVGPGGSGRLAWIRHPPDPPRTRHGAHHLKRCAARARTSSSRRSPSRWRRCQNLTGSPGKRSASLNEMPCRLNHGHNSRVYICEPGRSCHRSRPSVHDA